MSETLNCYRIAAVSGEPDWESIPRLSLSRILWKPDCGIRASGCLCHDAAYLYVCLRAQEKNIRAVHDAPLSPVHEDSCLEFFFMPEGETRYLNFEFNPKGCLHLGFGTGRSDRVTLYREDAGTLFRIRPSLSAEGWEVRWRVPLAFLRLFWPDFAFAGALRANVYKCGDRTVREHYLAWNPVVSASPDFHRPEDFGRMIFE